MTGLGSFLDGDLAKDMITDSKATFMQLAQKVNADGTASMDVKAMTDWSFEEQSSGTYIGTVICNDGFILSLSAGDFESGTQYPKKFGCVLKIGAEEICRFDWTANHRKLSDRKPHFHFLRSSNEKYFFEHSETWTYVQNKLSEL
ncbi:MAG: hypothetical protein HQK83_04660 [Fibrobacteria bacterium]|nr:hypothetical protein [Fibrobacteria bacterium]